MNRHVGQAAGSGGQRRCCASRRWRPPRRRRTSSRRCSAGSAARARRQIQLPFAAMTAGPSPRSARPRPRVDGGGQAYCVRTCDGRYFPITGPDKRAARRPATASARPATPRSSMAAASTTPRPTTANPIPNCRMRFAIATRWSRAAPATARTRSGSRRSRSKTTRRCARATSSPARTGWWSPAAAPTSAAPR